MSVGALLWLSIWEVVFSNQHLGVKISSTPRYPHCIPLFTIMWFSKMASKVGYVPHVVIDRAIGSWIRQWRHVFSHEKISFGGIPNSRTDLFLQIFLKRAAKPSARNNSACSKASQALSGTFSGTLLNLTWLCTKASQTFSGTFSGTLLNLTWLCTKASQAFSGTFYGTRWNWYSFAPRTFSGTFSGTLLNLTWLCTKASNLRNLLRNLVEPDPAPALAHTGVILGWRPH